MNINKIDAIKPRIGFALVDLTNVCNYSCKFCWYFSSPKIQYNRTFKGKPFFFPAAKVIEFIKDVDNLHVAKLCLTGEGEPTLHPHFFKIIKCLSKTHIFRAIQTNGAYDRKLRAGMLHFNEVCVNMSFLSPDVFKRTMNPGVVCKNDLVLENIDFLLKHRKRPKVTAVYIINKYNLPELEGLVERFNKIGVDELHFKIYEPTPYINEYLIFSKEEAKITALKLLAQRKRCRFKNNIFTTAKTLIEDYKGKRVFKRNPRMRNFDFNWTQWKEKAPSLAACESDFVQPTANLKRCLAPLHYVYLRLNGNIYSCPRNDWIEPIGNIHRNTLPQILESAQYRRVIREHLLEFDIQKPKWRRCKNCPLLLNVKGKYSYDYITERLDIMS